MTETPSTLPPLPPKSRRGYIPWFGLTLLLIVFGTIWAYRLQTQFPDVVRIAGGPAGGRHGDLAEGIARELRQRFHLTVEVLQTDGSMENLRLLESDAVHFCLYQSETSSVLDERQLSSTESERATFVSNLYPEILIPFGPATREDLSLVDPDHRKWSCNDRLSGDFAITRWLLQHLRVDEKQVDIESVHYVDLSDRLKEDSIDVGIICCGLNAPILLELMQPDTARLIEIPSVDALALKHPSLSRDVIPAGFFQTSPPVPAQDFQTVSLHAQLLAASKAPVRLVEEVTRIVTDAEFQRTNGLTDLFQEGNDYATDRPEFPMHVGASHIFFPDLKPLINPDFVEGTEGIRSFVVSFLVAAWLMQRWWRRRLDRRQEHRLDRYIRDLLQLERDQLDVDGDGGENDGKVLQNMLDQVTLLRQEALREFTAHELNEDHAVDCFVGMCHALSAKINAKLTRNAILHVASSNEMPANSRNSL